MLWGPRLLHHWPVTPLHTRRSSVAQINVYGRVNTDSGHQGTIAYVILLPERKAWSSRGGSGLSLLRDETGTVSTVERLFVSTPACGVSSLEHWAGVLWELESDQSPGSC